MAEQLGSKFQFQSSNSTSAVVFTPAQNVNGAVVRTANMHVGPTYGIMSTGTKAPTGYSDKSVPVILAVRGTYSTNGGFPGNAATLPFAVAIPAGQGLWVEFGDNSGTAYVTYDLLPAA